MPIADAFVDELVMEAATTKRVLDRVPEAHLGWQPHPKSMSLGQLALHVATLPSLVAQFLSGDALDFDSVPKEPPTVVQHAYLLDAFASSIERARTFLAERPLRYRMPFQPRTLPPPRITEIPSVPSTTPSDPTSAGSGMCHAPRHETTKPRNSEPYIFSCFRDFVEKNTGQ